MLRKVTWTDGPSLTLQISQVGRMHSVHRYLLDVLCTIKVPESVSSLCTLCFSLLLGLLAAIVQALLRECWIKGFRHRHPCSACCTTYWDRRCISSSDSRGPNVHFPCKKDKSICLLCQVSNDKGSVSTACYSS